jgi:uncharacterized membrane protein
MEEQDVYLFFAVFDDEQSASEAESAIREATKLESVHIDGLASVHRDQHGHVHLHETGDITGSQGAVRGIAAGALIGLIFPPTVLVTAAVGGTIGAVVAKFHDKGFKTRELHALGEELGKGQSAVIFVGDQVAKAAISNELKDADVSQRPMTPELKKEVAEVEGTPQ